MILAYALFFFLLDIVLLFFTLSLGWKVEIPAYFALYPALFPVLYLAWRAEKNRARLEQLADRLRRLYKRAGQPALRVRRPRRLHLETHQALQELEKSLRILERHHQIRIRRLRYPRLFFDDPKPVLDNMAQRLSRLEEIDVK